MPKRPTPRADNLRRALAQEAARIMAEHGISDFLLAKRKAAQRFGVEDGAVLPKNAEIELALEQYQRLFDRNAHTESLHAQRCAALAAMRGLREFEPRLVGAVLRGTATRHTHVQLHVFADCAESVILKLMEWGVAHEVTEKRMRMDPARVLSYPGLRFEFEEQPIDVTVFPLEGIRQAPVSPVDGRPMRRANISEVEAMLQNEPPAHYPCQNAASPPL